MRESVPSSSYPAFVMYCVNGASRSSLLIESTDSMIMNDQEPTYKLSCTNITLTVIKL